MSHKILVCSAGFGEGHNTAAHNLCTALLDAGAGRADPQFVDIFARRHPRTNDFLRRGYLTLMNRAPGLWSAVYRLFDSTRMIETNLAVFGTIRDALAELLEREQPSAVVATYPLYGYLLDAIAQRGGRANFLRVVVVTDSISINSIWYRCGADFFSVPNEETAAALRRGGVSPDKVRVLGFPVEPRFAALAALPPRPDPAGPEGRRVLYMINAGRRAAEEVLRCLLAIPDIALTVTVGRDPEMRATVERLIGAHDRTRAPVEVIGWTREVPALLASHHVLISKAGGATTQETIAARCPMIISQVAPGQEEGNAQLLVDNRAGCLALTPERIGQAVRGAFADDAKVCREWTRNIGRLSRPEAARDNARFILEQIEARAGN
jgi:processive 1,2-diacylglycerol beta-glucosyltransferase